MEVEIVLRCMLGLTKLLLIVFKVKQLQEATRRNPQNYMETHLLEIELWIIVSMRFI